jgi:hypothetical protein
MTNSGPAAGYGTRSVPATVVARGKRQPALALYIDTPRRAKHAAGFFITYKRAPRLPVSMKYRMFEASQEPTLLKSGTLMPIEMGIWKLGDKLQRVKFSAIDSESKLENAICADLSLLGPQLMLIGRQVPTDYGKFIDILTMDAEGNLNVVELKRNRTPREVVAQILDYGSWVQLISHSDIVEIYAERNNGRNFEEGFAEAFDASPPEKLNQNHSLVVVASELDPASERIINYLSDTFGVPINAVFFRYFLENGCEYITRTWLIDPAEAELKAGKSKERKDQEPWNGRDFYVSYGGGSETEKFWRSWEDARRYGFVSGGGGKWYIQTLSLLFPGARVFVNIPGHGYVGVGTVTEAVVPVNEFAVEVDGKRMPILEAPIQSRGWEKHVGNPEKCEHIVRVDWIKAVPQEEAYWEKGMFAVQHTVCRMRSSFTIERLSNHFGLQD